MKERRSIFLDIGGHTGETLEEILKPQWTFDRIISFEPHPQFHALLENKFSEHIASGQLEIVKAALSDTNGIAQLYGTNQKGEASLFADKKGVDASNCISIPTIKASSYVQTELNESDLIVAKFNCEGGEVLIVEDLLQAGCMDRINYMMIDFDIRKVKGGKPRAQAVIKKMNEAGFDRWMLAEIAMVGESHQDRIRNWLSYMPDLHEICSSPQQVRAARLQPSLRSKWKTAVRYGFGNGGRYWS